MPSSKYDLGSLDSKTNGVHKKPTEDVIIRNGKNLDGATKGDPNSGTQGDGSKGGCMSCCKETLSKPPKGEMIGTFELFKFSERKDKILMFFGTIGAAIAGALHISNVAIMGEIINIFTEDDDKTVTFLPNSAEPEREKYLDDMIPYIFAFLGVGVLSFISGIVSIACWTLAAENQIITIRKRFFLTVISQDIGWFDLNDSNELNSRFSEDILKIKEGLGDKVAITLQWLFTSLAAIVVAFSRSWKLALFSLPFTPAILLSGMVFFGTLRKIAVREAKAYAKAGGVAEQALRGIRTVQAFQGQEKECEKYDRNMREPLKLATRKGLMMGLGMSSIWAWIFILLGGTMWFSIWLTQRGDIKAGHVIPVFFSSLIGAIGLSQAFSNVENIHAARGAAVTIFKMLSLSSPIDAFSKDGVRPDKVTGKIEFKNIKFSYPARPDVMVSKNLNFTVEPGQHVALVGPSGCGKSTAIQLLQRFYDPTEGQVLLDGRDVRTLGVSWLRQQVGVVSQEPVLFDATIEENIRMGKDGATIEEIEAACKMSNAYDFIKQLPEGFKTNVGERGAQLSGGQKQRISIARALVRNPRILLMDEATSALDHESEALVQAALDKAGRGRSTITIAHRLSTVQHADKIVAICEGEVAEEGTHQELIQKEGLYFQLVQIQSKLAEEAKLDVSDVVIDAEDDLEQMPNDDLLRVPNDNLLKVQGSFKRTLSNGSSKNTHLVVRLSNRRSGRQGSHHSYNHSKRTPNSPGDNDDSSDVKVITEEPSEEASLLEIARYNYPEWKLIIVGAITSILAGLVQPSFSFILSEFIKIVSSVEDRSEQRKRVNVIAPIIISMSVAVAAIRITMNVCINVAGAHLTARMRKLAFASIINQDMEYFDVNQVSSITQRLSTDAANVQGATGSRLGQVLEAVATVCAALGIAFYSGWKLTLVVLTFLPIMILAGIMQGKVMAGGAPTEKLYIQQAGQICSETVENIRTVVSLGKEHCFVDKFNNVMDQNNKAAKKKSILFGITYSVANSVLFFAYAGAFYYGGTLIDKGEMEFFEVFRVFGAIVFGGVNLGRSSSFGMDYMKAKVAAGRILAIINRKPKVDVREETGAKPDNIQGMVNFKEAVFHYVSRPNVRVLGGFNLEITPGQTVALVGASGCGKSTTAQLVQRFYEVDGGAVMVDGHDIRSLNLTWYRKQIGVVSQEPTLFDCSIADNIAYGDNSREVPRAEIIEAAKSANIHAFISNLPLGYDTNVGEKGTQLSGGQKQRVAIARALVRDPKILILDEATSALDTESERIVQEALDRASVNRTCITIAHRLSTVQKADKIAVVSKGKVIESGTHKALIAIKGAYYRLHTSQGSHAKE